MELSPKLAELTPKAMEITPQALEIVTGRSERLNNRAANAYVISGKGLSARRSPANEGTYFFIRFWVGKNTELRLACFLLPPRMVAVYLI